MITRIEWGAHSSTTITNKQQKPRTATETNSFNSTRDCDCERNNLRLNLRTATCILFITKTLVLRVWVIGACAWVRGVERKREKEYRECHRVWKNPQGAAIDHTQHMANDDDECGWMTRTMMRMAMELDGAVWHKRGQGFARNLDLHFRLLLWWLSLYTVVYYQNWMEEAKKNMKSWAKKRYDRII